uniref:Uncharacterized protein n=1 Tax=Anopheles epiroticus TaxID=199890 RepID=A0A182PPT6_9DIPT
MNIFSEKSLYYAILLSPANKLLDLRSGRLPARRYSISGSVPLSSMVDYCNLSENAANLYTQSANLTNLLSETTKSLSRSSNILNIHSLGTKVSSESGHSLPMSHTATHFTQPSLTSAPTSSSTTICGAIDPSPSHPFERMAASAAASAGSATSYHYSYPNTSSISHLPNAVGNNANLSYYHHHLQYHMPQVNQQTSISLPQQLQQSQHSSFCNSGCRTSTDYLLSKPIYSNNTISAASNPTSYLSQPHSVLSQTKNLLSQHQFLSNPAITRSLTNLPSSTTSAYPYDRPISSVTTLRNPSAFDYPSYMHTINDNIDCNAMFNYPTTYHTPYSKLDLDYNRTSDMKRQ